MKISPELQALRGDPASQRLAQDALESVRDLWRASASVAAVLEAMARYGDGRPLAECPALQSLFDDGGAANDLIAPLMAALTVQLRAHPLGQIPFRHQLNDGLGVLQLALAGPAALSLLTYDTAALKSVPESACFSDGERHEIVLVGGAELQILSIVEDHGDCAVIERSHRRVLAGEAMHFPGAGSTKLVECTYGRMVVLRLARTPDSPLSSREFRLSDGQLVHRASGNRAESRHEMMMALLGRMGRTDAAPVLAEMTRSGSEHLRWQALRECLALDTATGFAALIALADNPADPLSGNASALRWQLLASYPQLARLEAEPCPA